MAIHYSTPRTLAFGRPTAILSIPLLLGLPIEPFVLPTVLFALLILALLITRREAGGTEVRVLLRDASGCRVRCGGAWPCAVHDSSLNLASLRGELVAAR